MDFVDLDKVLDDFEEEEKAATSRVPGQELKPSGYAQYIETHQDRPWEGLAKPPPTSLDQTPSSGGFLPPHTLYDVPFQAGKSLAEELQGHLKSEALITNNICPEGGGLQHRDFAPDSADGSHQPGFQHHSMLKSGLNGSDVGTGSQNSFPASHYNHASVLPHGSNLSHSSEGSMELSGHSAGERRGLMASQVIAVQTDALTPRSEKELLSMPLPQSDIIVEGQPQQSDAAPAVQNCARTVPQTQGPQAVDYAKVKDTESPAMHSGPPDQCTAASRPVLNGSTENRHDKEADGACSARDETVTQVNSPAPCENGEVCGSTEVVMDFKSLDIEVSEQDMEAYLEEGMAEAREKPAAALPTSLHKQNSVVVADGGHKEVFQSDGRSHVQFPETQISLDSAKSLDASTKPLANADEQCGQLMKSAQNDERCVVEQTSNHLDSSSASGTVVNRGDRGEASNSTLMVMQMAKAKSSDDASSSLQPADLHGHAAMESFHSDGTQANDIPASPAPSTSSSSDYGSPQLGVGARPKDPAAMKKNRPNSLLGLSKISMEPIPPVPAAIEVLDTMPPHAPEPAEPGAVQEDRTANATSHQQAPTMLCVDALQDCQPAQHVGMESDGSVPAGPPQPALAREAAATGVGEEGEDTSQVPQKLEDSEMSSGFPEASERGGRPHSWSPPGSSNSQSKNKRPSSLNLPVRPPEETSDLVAVRTRTVALLPQSQLAQDSEGAAGETTSAGEEPGALGEDQAMAAAAQESPTDDGSLVPAPILHTQLGRVAPHWVPDADAPNCMQCQARFTFTKRRHHCRACGKVFCSACCSLKGRLCYMENKEARVCLSCYQLLLMADPSSHAGPPLRSPNPNNPSEYCSTIPPTQQANARALPPTVMVPVGVLKREGSQRRSEPKQVIFSDGIRPGGDLTEIDGSGEVRPPPRRTGRIQKKVEKSQNGQSSPKMRRLRGRESKGLQCLIPDQGLPPIYYPAEGAADSRFEENPDPAKFMPQIRNEEADPVIFAINNNLFVMVKIINLDCCVNRLCWCFSTRGMCTVGQDELVLVLEVLAEETSAPRDIFCHLSTVYLEASKGNTVSDMGHTIFNQSFLDSREHGGFLYIRPTFQCLQKLLLPNPPYLFGILLQKWETPWAKVFPLRLLLRLGAEYRYYPCPLVSVRNHKPVFFEIGHTIMNLLADFRNYQYMLPQIRGITIHMEDKRTSINFPRNRYEELMKVVNNSNEHVMALGANFSPDADSHLVCIQNDEGNYQTQAINIQNKPRKVTGASFVVFNGALKASSGLRAKSSIVEDGLMVQIMPEAMAALKQALRDMKDYTIGCGPISNPQPEETVTVQWREDDKNVNIGVKSPIDMMALDGIESVRIHNTTDYVGENKVMRWTEVFFICHEDSGSSRWEPVDLSRLAESLAAACCIALTPHLDALALASQTCLGLRVTLDAEQVGYEIGANGEKLGDMYMNDLDSNLIPVIHNVASQSQDGPVVVELIFRILD